MEGHRKKNVLPSQPRMIDVARLADVSHQTVSRVLNDSPLVGPELKARVNDAIRLLGYRRNRTARALATRRTMNLGVVCFGIEKYGPTLALYGMAEASREAGYATSLVSLPDVTRETVRAALEHLVAIGVDGIAVIAPVRGAMDAVLGFSEELPLIAFEPGAEHGGRVVAIDEVLGAKLATRHLIELGHKTVWHVSGPLDWLGSVARIRGWREELAAHGLAMHEPIRGDWSAASGFRAGKVLAENKNVTAVYVANDQMSLGVIEALHTSGRRIPDEISIVGFDDIPEAAYFHPPLTTVKLDFEQVGRRCVEQLLRMIKGEDLPNVRLLIPELCLRQTTAPPH